MVSKRGGGKEPLGEIAYLKAGPGTGDAERDGRTLSDVRVVAFAQKLDDARYLARAPAEDESERADGGPADVIRDVRDGYV